MLYKYTTMLFKTSQNQKKIRENLIAICGETYTLLQKIKNDIYGSPKYLLLKISPARIPNLLCNGEIRSYHWLISK